MSAPLKKTRGETALFNLETAVFALLFMLGVWGCLSICNATFQCHKPLFYAGRQLMWLGAGLIVMCVCARVPFSVYERAVIPLALFSAALLTSLFLWATPVNGMRGWFDFGWVWMQPSEFSKPVFTLFLCSAAVRLKKDFAGFALLSSAAAVWIILVACEPDFGSAFIYFAGFLIIYWCSGGKTSHVLCAGFAVLPALALFINTNQYAVRRISGFLFPEADPLGSGWHVCQFRNTLARGGLWGASWGQALWSNSYLPLPHSDSAFAAMVESVGFFGALPSLLCVLLLLFTAYKLALRTEDRVRRTFIFSAAAIFAFQALLHISVNVTILPPTGITFPAVSYGGSSLVSTMITFGMILSAARQERRGPAIS